MSIVSNYMRKDFTTIGNESSATEASKTMSIYKVGYIVVLEKDRPVGIVTEKDLVVKVLAKDNNPHETKISDCMSSPMVTIDPDDSVDKAVEVMKKHGLRRLPVVKNNIIYGIFTARDIVDHYEEFEKKLARDIVRFMPW